MLVAIALVTAVIVTHIDAKKDSLQRCPGWFVRLAARCNRSNYFPSRSPVKDIASTITAKNDIDASSRTEQRESFDLELSKSEWLMVAKFTDHVFFLLFLVISLCTNTIIFIQMALAPSNSTG